jgi:hypothetical protein
MVSWINNILRVHNIWIGSDYVVVDVLVQPLWVYCTQPNGT